MYKHQHPTIASISAVMSSDKEAAEKLREIEKILKEEENRVKERGALPA